MKKLLKRSVWPMALLSLSVAAAEHTDSNIFDKRIIRFDQQTDVMSARSGGVKTGPISLTKTTNNGAELQANLSWLTLGKVKLKDGIVYDRILIPDAGGPLEPGEPNLTGYQQMIRIPDGMQLEVVIDEVTWSDSFEEMTIDPVQLPFPDVVTADGERPDQHLPFVKNKEAYALMPETETVPIKISKTIRVRGKSYAVISYQPIQFNPIEKTVKFANKVRFHVNYIHSEQKNSNARRKDPLKFDDPASNSAIDIRSDDVKETDDGAQNIMQRRSDTKLTASQQADYLIITADQFKDAVEPLAAWKRKMGYNVYTAPLSETGASQEEIKQYIKDAYQQGVMTSYVLFVGDHEDLPGWAVTGHGYHGKDHVWHTDFDYSLIDGDDKYPDIVVGRFPGDTAEQITTMVNRTLNYAKTPVISDRYKHILVAGQFQDNDGNLKADRMFMEDLHRVADFLGPDYDFFNTPGDQFNKGYQIHTALQWSADLSEDLTYGGWDYGTARITPPNNVPQVWKDQGNGDRVQIAEAINDGVSLVLHRDHGYGDGSGWADPHFTAAEVNNLVNGNLAPVVLSLNCATGWFDNKDSFAESWMRNTNGGAVGFTGAVRVSYSGYNDNLHAGIMDSFWDDYDGTWSSDIYPVSWKPAMALNRAKERMFNHYGTQGTALSEARFFSWFGDPEMELRTDRPQALTVTHPESLLPGSQAEFTVVVRKGNALLKNARVALVSQQGETQVVLTDDNGRADFDFFVKDAMTVTVTEHNATPYENSISVSTAGPAAKITADKQAAFRQWLTLSGENSTSSNNIVSYLWEQTAGPKVRIEGVNRSYAYAATPSVNTTLQFKLTVTDDKGKSSSAVHTVIIKDKQIPNNQAPVAAIRAENTALFNKWLVLDGNSSKDTDGSITSYKWEQVAGPSVRIEGTARSYAYAATPSFNTTLQFKLTVTDDKGKSSSAVHTVIIKDKEIPKNQAPVATIAAEKTALFNKWLALDGRNSKDTDGNITSYKWEQVAGPSVRIDGADRSYAYAATPSVNTTLKFKLTVTDDKGKSSSAVHTVIIKGNNIANNLPPVAKITAQNTASFNKWVRLDGKTSKDPDGTITSYKWEQVEGPQTRIAYADKSYAYAMTPNFNTTLKFRLTVTDNKGLQSSTVTELSVK
ncbi:C25 family cysteine peptidase [Psychromonas aquimarina]|uniref:C25 family cysteine peptidase n=1 Tax=Psychromonas aquimarina TaxID=444919 RepID=UPI0004171598|nr:C25 family cysteine peptidase [Psychromonas aquimarina]